jgi:hypothetical protein
MPVSLHKLKNGKVKVTTPNGTKAKGTTMAKAKKQRNLINAVDHGWRPTHNHESAAQDVVDRLLS